MSLMKELLRTLVTNPISTFAVLCVAGIGIWQAYMLHRMLDVLESPNWCATAVQAEKITPGVSFEGLKTCTALLTIQLEAVGLGFHISTGGNVFALLVLVIVVVAGARASFNINEKGISGDVSRHGDPAVRAAEKVADAAVDEAQEIKKDAQPPEYNGPAMPEPKK